MYIFIMKIIKKKRKMMTKKKGKLNSVKKTEFINYKLVYQQDIFLFIENRSQFSLLQKI